MNYSASISESGYESPFLLHAASAELLHCSASLIINIVGKWSSAALSPVTAKGESTSADPHSRSYAKALERTAECVKVNKICAFRCR